MKERKDRAEKGKKIRDMELMKMVFIIGEERQRKGRKTKPKGG